MATKKRPPKTGKASRRKASGVKGKRVTPVGKTATPVSTSETAVGKSETLSKSGFIRSMATTPAPEIIRLYKEQYGESINASLIYNVRNNVRKKAGKVGKKAGKASNASAKVASTKALMNSSATKRKNGVVPVALSTNLPMDPRVVAQFRSSVLRLGLDRADTLLKDLRTSLAG